MPVAQKHRGRNALLFGFVTFLFLLLSIACVTAFTPYRSALRAAVSPAVLTWFVNEERKNQSLESLTPNDLLAEAATRKAEDMAERGYFSHVSPEGREPWYWLDEVGYAYDYAGENLALDFVDSGALTQAWMESDTHRSNLLGDTYTEVGTGVATGTFEGFPVQFVVQLYARPE